MTGKMAGWFLLYDWNEKSIVVNIGSNSNWLLPDSLAQIISGRRLAAFGEISFSSLALS